MIDSIRTPPPLERFSAEKFRQWLAGMVSDKPPSTQTDRDQMKELLVNFLAALPMVYGLNDRLAMWEKIGNSALAALETCNHDLLQWCDQTLAGINAANVATCDRLTAVLSEFDQRSESWRVECLRVMRNLHFVLPSLARDAWNQYKVETGTEYKGDRNGDE